MTDLFNSGIRPAVDSYLKEQRDTIRNYGEYWSASSAGYCMRKSIFERLGVPPVSKDGDERKTRVFESGKIFHKWMQDITKEAGLSIAQELELQDEELMIRGHIDDLVLVEKPSTDIRPEIQTGTGDGFTETKPQPQVINLLDNSRLILYDYKTAHSRSFHYAKDRPMSHYHRMQLGTYMYMLRNGHGHKDLLTDKSIFYLNDGKWVDLTEARVMSISKDDLCMAEKQLLWTPDLEKDVVGYWKTLNGYWDSKKLPKCTCADFEGGFMAGEKYNPYYYENEPCSLKYYEQWKLNKKQHSPIIEPEEFNKLRDPINETYSGGNEA